MRLSPAGPNVGREQFAGLVEAARAFQTQHAAAGAHASVVDLTAGPSGAAPPAEGGSVERLWRPPGLWALGVALTQFPLLGGIPGR